MEISVDALRVAEAVSKAAGVDRVSVLAAMVCKSFGCMPEELRGMERWIAKTNTLRTFMFDWNGGKDVVERDLGMGMEELTMQYTDLFRVVVPNMARHTRECIERFKRFFSMNQMATPIMVLEATKVYLSETEPRYVMQPHYFIQKGNGTNATYSLEAYVERVMEGVI